MASVIVLNLFPSQICPTLSPVFNEDLNVVKQKGVPSFWRVKKWHFVCEVGLQDRGGSASSYSFDREIDVASQEVDPDGRNDFEGNTIENEKDLICASNNHMWAFASTSGIIDAEAAVRMGWNPSVGIQFNDSFGLSSKWDGYEVNEGEYKWGDISVSLLDQTYNLPMIGTAVGPVPCGAFGTGRLEFGDACFFENGEPIELELGPLTLRVNSVSGTLTAIEFWPYDPNDGGGPIYNTTTGQRIRFDV